MNLKTISVVISREYTTRVKKKSFLVTTFLVPVLFALLCCVPALIMVFNKDEQKVLAVVDESSLVMPVLKSGTEVKYVDCSGQSLDSLKNNLDALGYAGLLHVGPLSADNSVSVSAYSLKPIGMSILSDVENSAEAAVRDYRIAQYEIEGLKEIMDKVKADIDVKTFSIGEDGEDKISNEAVYMIISMVLGIIIFLFVVTFSSSVMNSVIEEKQSKIVEVLLSSVKSVDLMFGKIFGVALVALTQFLLWIILTTVIVSAVFAAIGGNALSSLSETVSATEDLSAVAGDLPGGADDAGTLGVLADADVAAAAAPDAAREVLSTLTTVDLSTLAFGFLAFFIFGYLLYASVFAAIGAAVENSEDAGKLQTPVTVPLMIAYFIALYAWKAPDSALSVWGSMIPFTSPIVMLTRIPFGVPSWQLWLSLALLVLTFLLIAWLSAKIYRVGILSSGKKATWKEMYRWIRQK